MKRSQIFKSPTIGSSVYAPSQITCFTPTTFFPKQIKFLNNCYLLDKVLRNRAIGNRYIAFHKFRKVL